MVSVLASIVVDCGFESWSGQTKDYEIVLAIKKNINPIERNHTLHGHIQENVASTNNLICIHVGPPCK